MLHDIFGDRTIIQARNQCGVGGGGVGSSNESPPPPPRATNGPLGKHEQIQYVLFYYNHNDCKDNWSNLKITMLIPISGDFTSPTVYNPIQLFVDENE